MQWPDLDEQIGTHPDRKKDKLFHMKKTMQTQRENVSYNSKSKIYF